METYNGWILNLIGKDIEIVIAIGKDGNNITDTNVTVTDVFQEKVGNVTVTYLQTDKHVLNMNRPYHLKH